MFERINLGLISTIFPNIRWSVTVSHPGMYKSQYYIRLPQSLLLKHRSSKPMLLSASKLKTAYVSAPKVAKASLYE